MARSPHVPPAKTNTEQRTQPLHVRMAPHEKAAATAKASAAGYSLSEYVRRFLQEWDGPTGYEERISALEEQMDEWQQRLERLERMAEGHG